MSVVFTGTYQGTFTSTGNAQFINLPAGVDYMYVRNRTQSYAAGSGQGVEFYWQAGMTQGQGTIYTKTSSTNALAIGQIAAGAGFYYQNTTIDIPSSPVAFSGISNATPPVVATGTTTGLIANQSIVRMYYSVGAAQLAGLDFTVGAVSPGSSFELAYMAPIVTSSGAGKYSIIPFDPYFYPTYRYITAICVATAGSAAAGNPAVQSNQAIVTLSVTHGYQVGQEVSFRIPQVTSAAFGMTQLNDMYGTIIAVGDTDANGYTNTIRVNIDVSSFTAFSFPLTGAPGFTPAQVIPVGENTAQALNSNVNILSDATLNTGQMGMLLQAGSGSPAGSSADVIDWVAGKSWNV